MASQRIPRHIELLVHPPTPTTNTHTHTHTYTHTHTHTHTHTQTQTRTHADPAGVAQDALKRPPLPALTPVVKRGRPRKRSNDLVFSFLPNPDAPKQLLDGNAAGYEDGEGHAEAEVSEGRGEEEEGEGVGGERLKEGGVQPGKRVKWNGMEWSPHLPLLSDQEQEQEQQAEPRTQVQQLSGPPSLRVRAQQGLGGRKGQQPGGDMGGKAGSGGAAGLKGPLMPVRGENGSESEGEGEGEEADEEGGVGEDADEQRRLKREYQNEKKRRAYREKMQEQKAKREAKIMKRQRERERVLEERRQQQEAERRGEFGDGRWAHQHEGSQEMQQQQQQGWENLEEDEEGGRGGAETRGDWNAAQGRAQLPQVRVHVFIIVCNCICVWVYVVCMHTFLRSCANFAADWGSTFVFAHPSAV